MSKNRLKLLLGLAVAVGALLGVLLATALLGQVVLFFGSGADFSTALNVIPEAPPDIDQRLAWLADETPPGMREMPPYVREQIGGAYLNAWAQWSIAQELGEPYGLRTYWAGQAYDAVTNTISNTVASGWQVSQSDLRHTLILTFYSDDGSIVAFTDHEAYIVQHLRQTDRDLNEVVESSSRYDIIMLLEDGNWRIRHLVRRGQGERVGAALQAEAGFAGNVNLDPAVTASQAAPLPSSPVEVRDGRFWHNGEPYMMAGINYYPQETPWTRFWAEYDSDQTARDFDLVTELGLNMVRIFVPFDEFGGGEPDPQQIGRLVDLLDRAQEAGLLVLVTLFDHRTDHHPSNWAADDRHLAVLVPRLASHPALLGWDIKNEPDRDYSLNSPALVDGWLRHVAGEIRHHDPVHPLTIGWSTVDAAAELTDVVDFVSYHYYGNPAEYGRQVGELREQTLGKPIVLQEFGMTTWNTLFPGGHTEAEQAHYYAELLAHNRQLDVAGHIAWTLFDFTDIPLQEFIKPWERGVQAHFGLIRQDGSHKPAAALVGEDAPLKAQAVGLVDHLRKPFNLTLMLGLLVAITGLLLLHFFAPWRQKEREG